jgi:hypothetical protein
MNNQIKFCNVQLFYKVITNYINYHFEHGFGSSHSLISLPLSSSLICIYLSLRFSHTSSFYYYFIGFLFEEENEGIQPRKLREIER